MLPLTVVATITYADGEAKRMGSTDGEVFMWLDSTGVLRPTATYSREWIEGWSEREPALVTGVKFEEVTQ